MDWLVETYPHNVKSAAAGSVPMLKMFGTVAGGWLMAKAALIAKQRLDENAANYDFYRAKLATARFYAEHILPLAHAYRTQIMSGAESTLALDESQF